MRARRKIMVYIATSADGYIAGLTSGRTVVSSWGTRAGEGLNQADHRIQSMSATNIHTRRLRLVPNTLDDVRARIEGMNADERAELSFDWLARIDTGTADQWTLGFAIAHQVTDAIIGGCGFKGPPGADGTVEIAYSVAPDYQGKGYATEAADALAAFAFSSGLVRIVRAHTLPNANASTQVLTKCGFRYVGEVMDRDDGLVWRWEKRLPSGADDMVEGKSAWQGK
jgi:ribosomal-protein-alanine N-acetyltransferase